MRYLPVLLLLAACGGESASKLADAHRPASSAKLSKIATLAPIVAQQPPLTTDEWKLPDGVRLDFVPQGDALTASGARTPNPAYNAALAFDHQLVKPSDSAPLEWQSGAKDHFFLMVDKTEDWLIEPACLIQTGKGRGGAEPVLDNLKFGLDWLERTKYVLVLRLPTRHPPGLLLEELRRREMTSYTGGRVTGDALLYDLEGGTFLGGFMVDVKSRSEQEVRKADVDGQLRRSLASEVDTFIRHKLAEVGQPPR